MVTGKMFNLTNKIIIEQAHHYGVFVGAIVYGIRDVGKSSYALKVAYQLYRHKGYSDEKAWKLAIKSLIFSMKDVVKLIDDYRDYDKRAPIVLWDDAGMHASSMSYHTDMIMARHLKGIIDGIKTITHCLILTTPTIEGLLSFLRRNDDYRIRIAKDGRGDWERKAIIYHWVVYDSKGRKLRAWKKDTFSCKLPDWVHNEYKDIRASYLDSFNDDMKRREDIKDTEKKLEKLKLEKNINKLEKENGKRQSSTLAGCQATG